MPVPSLLALFLCWLPGPHGDEQKKAIPSDVMVTARETFFLPLKVDQEKVARIRLYVSTDRGRTYRMEQEVPGRTEGIKFKAQGDGEYWFAVQVVDPKGGLSPPDVAKEPPAIKVRVQQDPKEKQAKMQRPPPLDVATERLEELERFMTHYHVRPSPERVVHFLDIALSKGVLEHPVVTGNVHGLDLFAHAFGHMARRDPKLVRQFEDRFGKATDSGRALLLKCLSVCGDDKTIKRLAAWGEDPRYAKQQRAVEAVRKSLADPGRKLPRELPAKTPEELDVLWADFLVTGEYAPVARILDVLDHPSILRLPKDPSKEPPILQKVAAWSMMSNLEQHPRLRELLRAHQKDRPEPSQWLIQEWLASNKEKS